MKKILALLIALVALVALAGCSAKPQQVSYENGTYRGTFADNGYIQVNVEFKLENNVVKSISFRHLAYKNIDYLKSEDAQIIGLRGQYQALADHLVGKDIRTALNDLYKPGDIVKTQVDAFTGATLRAGKVLSAVRDALNRGVYSK